MVVPPELFTRMFVHAVHGGTLVYARRLFDAAHRFPNVSIAEDAAFLRAVVMGGARLMRIECGRATSSTCVHGQNAWRFACGEAFDARGWTRLGEFAYMREDMPFFISHGASPCDAPRSTALPLKFALIEHLGVTIVMSRATSLLEMNDLTCERCKGRSTLRK